MGVGGQRAAEDGMLTDLTKVSFRPRPRFLVHQLQELALLALYQ